LRKVSSFLTSTDGIVLASWLLMSLVFGLSLATGPYTLTEQLIFLAITLGFGSFLVYALIFHKLHPLQRHSAVKTEEAKPTQTA
jgi:hypothetical protein